MEKLFGRLKELNGVGLSIPSLLAVLPLVTTVAIVIRITYGDINQALYILNELGLVQVWTQGAGALLLTCIPLFLAVLLCVFIKRAWAQKSVIIGFSAFIVALFVAFITPIYGILTGIFLIFLFHPLSDKLSDKKRAARDNEIDELEKDLKKIEAKNEVNEKEVKEISLRFDKVKQQLETRSKQLDAQIYSLIILLALIWFSVILWSYPALPSTTFTQTNEKTSVGMVMSRTEERALIYNTDSHSIEVLQTSEIKHESVCAKKPKGTLYGLDWSVMRHILEWNQAPTLPYAYCKE